MYQKVNHKITAFALIAISLLAVFYPDVGSTSRVLTVTDEGGEVVVGGENENGNKVDLQQRDLQGLSDSTPSSNPVPTPLEPSHPPYPPGIPDWAKPHNVVTPPPFYAYGPNQAPITPKPVVWWPPPSYFTLYPIYVNNQPNVLASKTPQPVTAPTIAPILPTESPNLPVPFNNGGVNGDPLIMGLSGQVFKFDGRSGAWYSAVSTNSFQWNFMTQYYEKCPTDSNNFISGVGITIGDRKLQVNVANPYNVDVGCASDTNKHCLGGGSLELIIDGVKHVVGGDYTFKDGTGRIIAFNTYHQCSRKWYDFDVRPPLDAESGQLESGRRLDQPSVFDVLDGLKKTMIDPLDCENWLKDRREFQDLFLQPGLSSTILIETTDITLHLEYRQENERCNAHSIDVWIASVSPALIDQPWEGIIGETKKESLVPYTTEKHTMMDRYEILKFKDDDDYEVLSPFSTKCKACYKN